MVVGTHNKRRCYSTSATPSVLYSFLGDPDDADDPFDDRESSIHLLPKRTRGASTSSDTNTTTRDFSRRLSLTTERMMNTRRSMAGGAARRCSVIVDNNRQPIALLQTINGKEVAIRPMVRQLTSGSSINQLFEDPYGVEGEPRISQISMQSFVTTHHYRDYQYPEAVDEQEFRKQCQLKGEYVKRTDYMLLNVTVIFILCVIVTAIIFFSTWHHVWKGPVWALYVGLGLSVSLVCLALLMVNVHFWLKSLGYNLLFRNENKGAPAKAPTYGELKEEEDILEDVELGKSDPPA